MSEPPAMHRARTSIPFSSTSRPTYSTSGPPGRSCRARNSPISSSLTCASEELRLDRLRRDEDVIVVAADPGDEPPHVLAVRDDRVRVAVDVAGDGERQRVRERARLRPDRRPEHERAPVAARAQVGRREDRAAGVRGDHRVVVAGDLERGARPVNPPGGERRRRRARRRGPRTTAAGSGRRRRSRAPRRRARRPGARRAARGRARGGWSAARSTSAEMMAPRRGAVV